MAVNIAGVVRDYWTSVPIASAQVTTLGLKPLLVGTSDETGRFTLSGRARITLALLAIKGPAGYVETIMPVALADTPMVIDTWAVTASDLARQSAALGKVPVPNTTVVIVDLVDAAGQPLERVPLTDVSLLGSDGGPLGDGPYYFGPGGDLQGQSDLSTSCAFDGQARVAFLAVPEGNHTLQVTARGPDNRLAQLALQAPARVGATLLEARMANAT